MTAPTKTILRALAGEAQDPPPAWMMRQAGRYLPEYRATRAQAGSFLDLCYTPELAAEVTLQPIRRYGFDAAILFADILLVAQALGLDLWFVEGEGPKLSTVRDAAGLAGLRPTAEIDATLSPVYETVRILRGELPAETTLIGFAGAPWTVATYMIEGAGSRDHAAARGLLYRDPATFQGLIDRLTAATTHYLLGQIEAGAEVVMLFDSWAGALPGRHFTRYATAPVQHIVAAIRARHPGFPVIGFPRQAGEKLLAYTKATGVSAVAIDTSVDPVWAAETLQPHVCVQGNLDPTLMITGGPTLRHEVKRLREILGRRPYIFNLGHGITPEADPDHVHTLLDALRH
ncbi:MAG: uroporphyrinogen decarboxylase [Pseudomonadota bacterium]